MEIKAIEVKKLRDKTGAGMMECKKALVDAAGDFAKAEKILKELGLAAAAKRAGRATNEGRIFIEASDSRAAVLELSCETDFVAKNEDFQKLGNKLAGIVLQENPKEKTKAMEDEITSTVGIIKENIQLRRFITMEAAADEFFSSYIHGEGRIGVVLKIKAGNPDVKNIDAVKDLAFNLALHIAAFSPLYVSEDRIDASYLKEQEEIFTKQASQLGKPENVLAGIVKGKMKKHFAEICLVDQNYVRDEKFQVRQVLENAGKETGTTLAIVDFIYFKVGEELPSEE
ncbi:MAG: elongation factor Ts [Spirochaetales bacterium]|nr:elongation factor Ts [Spirochaetales bacterium]